MCSQPQNPLPGGFVFQTESDEMPRSGRRGNRTPPKYPPPVGSFSKTNPPISFGTFRRNQPIHSYFHQKYRQKTVGSFRKNTCFCRPRLLAGVAALGERGSFRRFSPCSRSAPCPESFRGESPCCLRIAGPAPIARSGPALRLPLHWRGPP